MEPRMEPKRREDRREDAAPARFRIVKLEERIAPCSKKQRLYDGTCK